MGDQAEQDRGLEMFRVGLEDLAVELFRLKQVARLVILLGDVQCLDKRVHDYLIFTARFKPAGGVTVSTALTALCRLQGPAPVRLLGDGVPRIESGSLEPQILIWLPS